MNISIFGLGYVGCVGVGCLAKLGHKVIGVDVNQNKVNQIAGGKPTIIEKDIDILIASGVSEGAISATTDTEYAVLNSDISFICVGTPNSSHGHLDLSFVNRVAADIGNAIRNKSTFHVVVIRSTVLPGTNKAITNIISERSGKKAGDEFAVVSNPEFLREGSAVSDFMDPPLTVLGSNHINGLRALHNLYEPLGRDIMEVEPKVAELIKYVNNSFHALKVAFGNEIGAICKELEIDSHSVMELFCKDRQLNISPAYFKPGFAYGGSCLPKDLKGLNAIAHDNYVHTPILKAIDESNKIQIERVARRISESNSRNICLIGLTFKAGTDDLRNSAAVEVAEYILGKGFSLTIYDKYLNTSNLTGTNKIEIERRIPHLNQLLCSSIQEAIESASLVIINNNDSALIDYIRRNPSKKFIDLVRLNDKSLLQDGNYEGLSW